MPVKMWRTRTTGRTVCWLASFRRRKTTRELKDQFVVFNSGNRQTSIGNLTKHTISLIGASIL